MAKLMIKNFGPIKEGLDSNNGILDFGKYTLFIGDQGTGKSTVSKVISLCSWLEKAFFRGDFSAADFDAIDFEALCRNQLLDSSFNESTELEYAGEAYHFWYKKSVFFAEEMKATVNRYIRPKIMYIPSERNILSIVKNVEELDNIPPMLRLLRRRYLQASASLDGNCMFDLPLPGYKAVVNKSNGETFVKEEESGKSIPLVCASSGLQSIVPSSLVTEYLAKQSKQTVLEKLRSLNDKVFYHLKESLNNDTTKTELERYITSGISKSISASSLAEIESVARKFTNAYFMNIIEEPEQNLFPDSQMKNLAFFLACANTNTENKIVITTHSPYILSYITLAAKAYELLKRKVPTERVEKIVPTESAVDGSKIFIYEMQKNGSIKKLESYENLPSDENLLNKAMAAGNEYFSALIDLEQEFCA